MSHPLENKLAKLRRRVRLLAAVYSLSAVISTAIAALILLGLMDYLLRFQDRGARVFASLALLAAFAWACYRFFYLPGIVRFRDVDLAIILQRHFPVLEDRLLSAVEFLARQEDDPIAGSPALRRWVIQRATDESRGVDFNQAVSPRPVVRTVLFSMVVCAAAAALLILDPAASRTAVARLFNPLNNAAWPQKNHLAIRRPVERVGRGQPFEIEVIDSQGTPLPEEVRIHYRFTGADGASQEETSSMRQLGQMAIARRENVLRPFSYRVEGGDDHSMPWQSVEVVEPPEIASLSIRLFPPAYTGRPAEKCENNVRALEGTRLEIEANTSKPLQKAELCLEDGRAFSGLLSGDGFCVFFNDAALVVQKSGAYWFRLVDRQGLLGDDKDRWEITALADDPPSVTIERPVSNVYVTPQAVVPIRIAAKDDLAIREIALAFRSQRTALDSVPDATAGLSSSAAQDTVVPLYTGPQQVARPGAAADVPGATAGLSSSAASGATPTSGQRRVIEYGWHLEPLRLAPGMQVVFQALAMDYKRQITRSEPRRLNVVTAGELQDRIAGRQNLLLSEVTRALKMQHTCRAQVDAAQKRLDEIKRLEQSELDLLRAAELGQRRVNLVLTSRGEGIPSHVYALLADLENNRIDNPDLKRRLDSLLEEIDRLQRDRLPVINRELTSAVKSFEVARSESTGLARPGAELAAALTTAGKNQDGVISTLENLIAQLSQPAAGRLFQRDLGQLLREEQETARQTAEVGRRTLAKELKELSPQDAAELRRLASRQFEHARLLEGILQDMQRAGDDLRQNDHPEAKRIAAALAEAGRQNIGGQMWSCGENLRQNQLGQAAGRQKTIIGNLQEMLDILAGRRGEESAVEKTARLSETVKNLHRRQKDVLINTQHTEQMRQSQGRLGRAELPALGDLARLQRALQVDAAGLGGQFAGDVFGLALDGISRDMDRAAGLLDRGLTGEETQQAQSAALHRLELVLEALKPETPQTQPSTGANVPEMGEGKEGQKVPQRTISLAELKLLKMLQREINARTVALAQSLGPNGKPTDQQRRQYAQLAEEQNRLAEMVMKMVNDE
jgi:hypothetical protein